MTPLIPDSTHAYSLSSAQSNAHSQVIRGTKDHADKAHREDRQQDQPAAYSDASARDAPYQLEGKHEALARVDYRRNPGR